MKRLYVCNFPFSMTSKDLAELFSVCGEVLYAVAMRDRETNAPLGYGFVMMQNEEGLNKAIKLLNEKEISNRIIRVTIAREEHDRKRAVMLGQGKCVMCKREGDLAGYEPGFGVCQECSKILSNLHYHNSSSKSTNIMLKKVNKES